MCALSRHSPATRTCAPSAATATTDMSPLTKSHASSPKSEAGSLLPEAGHSPRISAGRPDDINPPVAQRRGSVGFGAGLGEDAVDRALGDLESGGNLGPGASGGGELDHLGRLGAGVRRLSLVLALGLGAG